MVYSFTRVNGLLLALAPLKAFDLNAVVMVVLILLLIFCCLREVLAISSFVKFVWFEQLILALTLFFR